MAVGGVVLLLLGSLVGAASPSVEWLIAARVASGLGSGLMTGVILTGLSWTASARNRGAVMSLFQLANNSGIAVYPLVGGAIGAVLGWRLTFVVSGAGAIIAGLLLVPLLGRIERGRKKEVVAGLVDTLEFDLSPRRRRVALGSVYAGVVANMIQRHGVRNTVLPLFAGAILGLGPIEIASGITLMSLVGIVVVTPGARLGDRIGRRRIVVVGMLILAVGDVVFLGVASYPTFLLAAAVIGSGDFFSSSQTALLSELVEPRHRARVLAGYRFFVDIGALLGPLVLAALFDAFGPQVGHPGGRRCARGGLGHRAGRHSRRGGPDVVTATRHPGPERKESREMTPDDVVARIDPNEVVELALALGNLDSPTGSEGIAGQFVHDWLAANGFAPRTFALTAGPLQRRGLDRRRRRRLQPDLQRPSRHDAPPRRGPVGTRSR